MQEAAFGDSSAVRRTLRFKGEAGKFYRIGIMDPKSWSANVHWTGQYVSCLRDAGGQCPACDKEIRRSQRFGNNLVVYALDMNARPIVPVQFSIMFWAYGSDVWTRLANLYQRLKQSNPAIEYPQWEKDLFMECQEARFQKFQIDLTDDAPLWRQNQQLYTAVQAAYTERKADIKTELGRTVTAQEMLRMINDPNNAQQGGRQQRGDRSAMAPVPAVPMDPSALFGNAGGSGSGLLPPTPSTMSNPPMPPVPLMAPAPPVAPAPLPAPLQVPSVPMPAPVPPARSFLPPADAESLAGTAVIAAPPEAGDGMMKIQALEQERKEVEGRLATMPSAAPAVALMPPVQTSPGMQGGMPSVTPSDRPQQSEAFKDIVNKIKSRRGKSA